MAAAAPETASSIPVPALAGAGGGKLDLGSPVAAPLSLARWMEEHQTDFLPPVCNKLMFGHEDLADIIREWYTSQGKTPPDNVATGSGSGRNGFGSQLKVMFVVGPNERTDYHIEEGEELFYMIKGSMRVKVQEHGVNRDIRINEGEMYLLPARVPHSPQRDAGSIGLVVERERLPGEQDGMRWMRDPVPGRLGHAGRYATGNIPAQAAEGGKPAVPGYLVPGTPVEELLWHGWFHCLNLGSQLGPVIHGFRASAVCASGVPDQDYEAGKLVLESAVDAGNPQSLLAWAAAQQLSGDDQASIAWLTMHGAEDESVEASFARHEKYARDTESTACDAEFRVRVGVGQAGQAAASQLQCSGEALLFCVQGSATAKLQTASGEVELPLAAGDYALVPAPETAGAAKVLGRSGGRVPGAPVTVENAAAAGEQTVLVCVENVVRAR